MERRIQGAFGLSSMASGEQDRWSNMHLSIPINGTGFLLFNS